MQLNVTQKDAAAILNRSVEWMRQQPDAPRNEDKTYPVPELVRWFVDRESETESSELKDTKLREEINVLKERNRKLQYENDVTAGNLGDVRLMKEMLLGIIAPLQKLGETIGRKPNITGRDAQQMINQALLDYDRELNNGFDAA